MRWCRGYCLKMCFPKTFVDTPLMELCRWARREPGSYPAQLLSEAEATAMAGKVEEWLTQW